MKKLFLMIIIFLTFNVNANADVDILKDYSFKANDFIGTPEMLFEKGIVSFKLLDKKTTGWANELDKFNILALRYNKNSHFMEMYTWNNKVPAKRMYRDKVELCDKESNKEKCDFKINKLFFDFINENEGIMYYGYMKPDRYAYFYFDKDLKLETRREYLNRIKDTLL